MYLEQDFPQIDVHINSQGGEVFAGIAIYNALRASSADIKIFVDTDADVRLARRVVRDVESRGRTVRSIVDQWQTTVKPMHEMYVEPSKKSADIIVPEGGDNPVALDLITGKIERHLAQHI